MSDSGDTRTITARPPATRLYRKPPGLGWLLAVIAVPLLLGLIGWSGMDRSGSGAAQTLPSVDPAATLSAPGANAVAPTPTAGAPNRAFAPLSITRGGNDITLTGDLPDNAAKPAVLDQLRAPCAARHGDVAAMLNTPINFTTDGFGLAPDSQQLLTRVADKLKTCSGSRVAVTGHTDNSGTAAINLPLSASRAKSVADYLVSQGLAPEQVTSNGVGSANPIATNDTPAGRAQNRRVEIAVS